MNEITNRIISDICHDFGVSKSAFFSRLRTEPIANARSVFMYIAYYKLNYTLEGIGKILNRHHSTVLHGLRSTKDMIDINYNFRGHKIRDYVENFNLEKS